jgi:hypothetical protein
MAVTLNASTSSGLVSTADTSGTIELQSNGTTRLTVASTGAYGQLVQATAQTASGSSVDFTGIPSWVKRITVQIVGLSYAAAGQGVIQIGSGSLTTSGYNAITTTFTAAPTIAITTITNGLTSINTSAAAAIITGQFVITNITGNTWILSGMAVRNTDATTLNVNGSIALGGTLDRLSLVATTSTFDAGSINILYEG